ncbi:MAG: hypothetical protein JW801_05850 [Bacteroidales bacterium]|nr:hypothetical protein [Bacteroidales bacterium]
MEQETLISLYGYKPEAFSRHVSHIRSILRESNLRDQFNFYDLEQVHGTLIGLEVIEIGGKQYNLNFKEREEKLLPMDLTKMSEVIREFFPMQIRIGGFGSEDEPFLSQGKSPWERSFFLDALQGRVVLMGWPHLEGSFSTNSLMKFRDRMGERCHARHKYSGDNDFYMVLGEWDGADGTKQEVENRVRSFLSENPLEIRIDELFIASYTNPRLIRSTTRIKKCWP